MALSMQFFSTESEPKLWGQQLRKWLANVLDIQKYALEWGHLLDRASPVVALSAFDFATRH